MVWGFEVSSLQGGVRCGLVNVHKIEELLGCIVGIWKAFSQKEVYGPFCHAGICVLQVESELYPYI